MWGIVLVIALIGGVYAFGRYTSTNEKSEKGDVIKNNGIGIIVKISLAFISSIIIVFTFIILFESLGFQQEQIGIVAATIIVFTMIICTYLIIQEIRKLKHNNEES